MTDCIYLRLAAPLQSWAGASVTGNIVHTELYPTPSALRGMIAGALGNRRGEWPEWLENVQFAVRSDIRPLIADDFQTINPRTGEENFRRRILIMQGKSVNNKQLVFTPDAQSGTSIVRRTYLSGTEFLVQIAAGEHTAEVDRALSNPKFVNYLGRKAFAPAFPFYLGTGDANCLYQIPAIQSAKNSTSDTESMPDKSVVLRQFITDDIPDAPHNIRVPTVASRDKWLDTVAELLTRRTQDFNS